MTEPKLPPVAPTPEQAAKIAELKHEPAIPVSLAPRPEDKTFEERKMGQLTQPGAKPAGTPAGAEAAASTAAPTVPAGVSRRGFLQGSSFALGWTVFAGLSASAGAAMQRFLYPNVLFEPPLKFRAGFPADFTAGKVDERFKAKYGAWLVRNDEGIYALSTVCTHLGCTPNWLEGEDKFKCPCHGSGYHKDGVNFEGPTPRPLERFAIALSDDGQIEIDKSRKYRYERGDWEKPEAFLKFKG